jgi:hypothetical protein
MVVTVLLTSPSDETAELGDDLVIPRSVTISDMQALGGSGYVEIEAVFDEAEEKYVAARVTVGARDGGADITSAALRSVRVQELLQEGLGAAVDFQLPDGSRWPFPLDTDLASFINKSGPSSFAAMEWVSRIYRPARAMNLRPAKAVQDQLRLSVPTASVWIRRARDRGFLPDTPRVDEAADG